MIPVSSGKGSERRGSPVPNTRVLKHYYVCWFLQLIKDWGFSPCLTDYTSLQNSVLQTKTQHHPYKNHSHEHTTVCPLQDALRPTNDVTPRVLAFVLQIDNLCWDNTVLYKRKPFRLLQKSGLGSSKKSFFVSSNRQTKANAIKNNLLKPNIKVLLSKSTHGIIYHTSENRRGYLCSA